MFKVFTIADTRINTVAAQPEGIGTAQEIRGTARRRPTPTPPRKKRIGVELNDITSITEYDMGRETVFGVVILELKNGRSWYVEADFDELTDAMQKARKSIYT